jgi:hypothetical protein
MNPQYANIRRRIQMFYFIGGANVVMGIFALISAGWPTGALVMLVFTAFALLQFYMARNMRLRWEAQMRQQTAAGEQTPEQG